jgi:8-oxo-dGTP diphosphatase
MEREHRISAGAIVIREGKVLLVRYMNRSGHSFLAGPGGGVLVHESTNQAAVREVLEETGLEVCPGKILFVEDMLSQRHRITKIWFLCALTGGKLTETQDAREEGIIEAWWYTKEQLKTETVYPSILVDYDWDAFFKDDWQTKYAELREVDF